MEGHWILKNKIWFLILVVSVFVVIITILQTKIGLKDIEKQLFKNFVYVGYLVSGNYVRELYMVYIFP